MIVQATTVKSRLTRIALGRDQDGLWGASARCARACSRRCPPISRRAEFTYSTSLKSRYLHKK